MLQIERSLHMQPLQIDFLRNLYRRFGRDILETVLFDWANVGILTRRQLLDAPPSYIASLYLTDDPEDVLLNRPRFHGEVPQRIAEITGKWTLDPLFVATLSDVQLVGPHATPILPDGKFILENVDGSTKRLTDEFVRITMSGDVPVRRQHEAQYGEVLSLVGPWSCEFFHWFVDYIPRLRRFESDDGEFELPETVFIPSDPPSFITESLDYLGIGPDKRVKWDGRRTLVSELVVPSIPRQTHSTSKPVGAGYIHSPSGTAWMSRKIRNAVLQDDDVTVDSRSRLFVSRRNQPTRNIANGDELQQVLDRFGIEIVTPEEWPLAEQVRRFANAELVIGPHGAGLTNTFYGEGCALVELFGNRINPCYYSLADGLGMTYYGVVFPEDEEGIWIDPDVLVEMLSDVLNED